MEFKNIVETALRVKNKYRQLEVARMGREWNLSEMTEGFVVDTGDLMGLVMAKEGKRVIENVDEKLKEELSDCLWAILSISEKLGIDLEKEFVEKMAKLEVRVDKSLENPMGAD
jgi:NTP pyrophosphatase (non-canonical NTP hydrolase)